MSSLPTQPKKPQATYFIFINEKRAEIIKELGCGDVGKVGKRAGELWKGMTDVEKQPFEAKAKVAKEQYEKDMAAFVSAGGVVEKRKKSDDTKGDTKGDTKIKDENAPKRPQSSYFIFLNEKREDIFKEIGAKDIGKAGKRAAELWKAMTDSEKEPFEAKAKIAKVEYERALEEYRKSDSYAATQAAKVQAKAVAKLSPASPATSGTPDTAGQPAAKRARRGSNDEMSIQIDEATIQAAGELASALKNLAARPEAKGKSTDEILKALRENNGLVNKAKLALAGA